MQKYAKDERAVMTLDAGGTKFVFSAMQANRPIVESFALPSRKIGRASCRERVLLGV